MSHALITFNDPQGSPSWIERRYGQDNASDVGAMLGVDDNRSRSDLLDAMQMGFAADVTPYKQRILDSGHAVEAAARHIAEAIIGEDLYTLSGARAWEGLSRPLGASSDGLTIARDTNWECKRLNAVLREALPHPGADGIEENDASRLPKKFRGQMEQQLLVFGAERVLFTAAELDEHGNVVDVRHCWYRSDAELRAEVLGGWAQFEADLAVHQPRVVQEIPKGIRGESLGLPAVIVRGQVVSSTIASWRPMADAWLAGINTVLKTDDHFGQADVDARLCRETSQKVLLLRDQVLGQMADVSQVVSTLEQIADTINRRAIDLENLVAERKTQIRKEIADEGRDKLMAHIANLDEDVVTVAPPGAGSVMPTANHPKIAADFDKAIKGKRTVKTLHDAVDAELARAKIAASALAQGLKANLRHLAALPEEHRALIADWRTLMFKEHDDFTVQVKARVDAHEAAQARKREEEAATARAAEERRQREANEQAQRAQQAQPSEPMPQPDTGARYAPLTTARAGINVSGTVAGAPAAAVSRHAPAVVPMPSRAPATPQKPTLSVGAMNARIGEGFTMTRQFIARMGVQGTPGDRGAVLYTEHEFDTLLESIKAHLTTVQAKQAEAA